MDEYDFSPVNVSLGESSMSYTSVVLHCNIATSNFKNNDC